MFSHHGHAHEFEFFLTDSWNWSTVQTKHLRSQTAKTGQLFYKIKKLMNTQQNKFFKLEMNKHVDNINVPQL